MRLFILAAVAAIGIALAGPAVAVPEPQIPEWVLRDQAPDYVKIRRGLFEKASLEYLKTFNKIMGAGLMGAVPRNVENKHVNSVLWRMRSEMAEFNPKINPGYKIGPAGGTIETGYMVVHGDASPRVYRIQIIGENPQIDIYYDNPHKSTVTMFDALNKITFLVTSSGVQILDASLPSIQANTSFVGLVGGTGVTISKNEIMRGLGVLADFINAQRGNTGLCGGGAVSFMDLARAIILDDQTVGAREALVGAIKTGKYSYRCEGSKVQLLF